ncbi:MAG: hypothetical protein KDA89_19020, partial [Planctomycetaceae bacterium]|nr:hypothetical protein [Planctomycetaceae bacterium]
NGDSNAMISKKNVAVAVSRLMDHGFGSNPRLKPGAKCCRSSAVKHSSTQQINTCAIPRLVNSGFLPLQGLPCCGIGLDDIATNSEPAVIYAPLRRQLPRNVKKTTVLISENLRRKRVLWMKQEVTYATALIDFRQRSRRCSNSAGPASGIKIGDSS